MQANVVDQAERSEPLPVAGEVSDRIYQRVAGGQPMALTLGGKVVAVVIDRDSWDEIESLAAGE